jgi:glycosyltransferase involved in cell wall biosynthesis
VSLVSVVTPAYNAAEFIAEAIRSVHEQTHRPIEHIVVDDASTDGTARVLAELTKELSGSDYELKVLTKSTNGGAAAALVDGIAAAHGDAISWLSADDAFIEKTKTEHQLALLQRGLVVFDTRFRTGPTVDRSRLVRARWPLAMHLSRKLRDHTTPDAVAVGLLMANPVNGTSVLMRRHVFDEIAGFDAALGNLSADGDLWLRLSVLGVSLTPRHSAGTFYRRHAAQTSQDEPAMTDGTTRAYLRVVQALHERDLLVSMLRRNRRVLTLALVSRQHRAWPAITATLAGLVEDDRQLRHWAHVASRDLHRRGLVDLRRIVELTDQARALQASPEFQRFLGKLDRGHLS